MAKIKGGFSSGSLKAALDSSPLWGSARVEDTYNLLGHALRKALSVIARQQQQDARRHRHTDGGTNDYKFKFESSLGLGLG